MGFYEEISKYYDYIFPVGQSQLKFIREAAGNPPARILDVACGSGGYSAELAKSGYNVSATDLDDEMVSMAREKAAAEGMGINVIKADMRQLLQTLRTEGVQNFKCIFCIGNSIVHLGSLGEITGVLGQMHALLDEGGTLILQIINFDRVIKYHINELPPIRNEEIGLEFIRKYEYVEDKGVISFNTVLTINNKDTKHKHEDSIELLPVRSEELRAALTEAGFSCIEFFGDFNGAPYSEDAYMLVVKAGSGDWIKV